MNKIALTIALIISAPGVIYPSFAAQEGRVNFYGSVVSATCVVAAESQDQVIYMGQVRSNQLLTPGKWSNTTPFRIVLDDCINSTSEHVAIMFNGTTDARDPHVFSIDVGGDSAKGVGIGIFDFRDEIVVPGSRPVHYSSLQNGQSILSFSAKYRATDTQVVAGNASAQILFNVFYP